MKTIEQLKDIIENNEISISNYKENGILCGYELNAYTNKGVNEILFLDFRDENKDPNNPKDFIQEFEDYINYEKVDDRVHRNMQDKKYREDFTIKQSLKDFTKFDKKLKRILKEFN